MVSNLGLGQIVLYTLSEAAAIAINKRRADFYNHRRLTGYTDTGYVAHNGNVVYSGDTYPAIVVRAWGDGSVNLQVLMDGNDTLWATSVYPSPKPEPGKYCGTGPEVNLEAGSDPYLARSR